MGFVDDLENSIDIVELVGRYAKLKKTGANYKAHCPFPGHSEKTPSFVVSPAKQIGYCFGCHKGGGPVKFIMDMENCEFRESIEILGQITGKEIKGFTQDKEQMQIKKSMYSLYKDATNYYKQALEKNPDMKKYLTDRGMTEESIKKFHFGYADSGVNLFSYLKEKGYDDEIISASQIFLDIRTKKDKFIGRIIFPIQNLRGDFVAFAGRITGEGEPKYLNSPASNIYDKSAILYGLYDARNTITKEDFVIITEGYMDTISLHEAGFTNTVAVSGTALTEKHIQIISRLTHKIYLCFDNDKAGEQATRSSLEILKNKNLEIKIIVLKGGKDPDEIIKKGKDFGELIISAITPIAFYIEKSDVDISSIDEKKKFLSEVLGIVKSYSDEIEKESYIKEISKLLGISEAIIYDELKKKKTERIAPEAIQNITKFSQEEMIIGYVMSQESWKDIIETGIVFSEGLSPKITQFLENPSEFLKNLELDTKERYKALAMKIESGEEISQKTIATFLKNLNIELYKKISANLKKDMEKGDKDAFEKYSNFIKKAKKHNIK